MFHTLRKSERRIVGCFLVCALVLCCMNINFTYKSRIDTTIIPEKPKNTEFSWLDSIANIPNFDDVHCDELALTNVSDAVKKYAVGWKYSMRDEKEFFAEYDGREKCDAIISHYGFNLKTLSKEEKDYPLAYGLLVYKWIDQLYYMMSSIYHPQNAYCIAVDNKSSAAYKDDVYLLQKCLPNVHVMIVRNVSYCGHTVLTAVYACLQQLASLKHNWKYYQYLTGVDLPLRTNHEMVRIFKRLNGSFNGEVKQFQQQRLKKKAKTKVPGGIKMFKSSLSATFSRKTANFLAKDKTAKALIEFLNGTYCPDESFWTSMVGSPSKVKVPGSFNATKFYSMTQLYQRRRRSAEEVEDVTAMPFYISRFQSWQGNPWKPCKGKYVSTSCVFGAGDVPTLLLRPQLVAHKFYLNYQPAAFFCVYKKVRERTILGIKGFDDKKYGNLPGPRITRGESVLEWFKAYAK